MKRPHQLTEPSAPRSPLSREHDTVTNLEAVALAEQAFMARRAQQRRLERLAQREQEKPTWMN